MHVKPEKMERTSDGNLHRRPHLAHVEQFPGSLGKQAGPEDPSSNCDNSLFRLHGTKSGWMSRAVLCSMARPGARSKVFMEDLPVC